MTSRVTDPRRPFGRLLTAMVTPMRGDGSLDLDGVARLATHLVDDTRHTIELARTAEKVGAHGTLVVTPYYNRPPRAGLYAHFTAVADATGLPMMVYDIPVRTSTPIETETMCRLAEHDRIVAVKDAKGALLETAWVTRRTDLAIYAGDDGMTLPGLSVGGMGVVGTSTHLTGVRTKRLIEDYESGDVAAALDLHHELLPLFTGVFRTQGVILVKAALGLLGLPAGPVRLPMVDATEAQIAQLRSDAADAGVDLPEAGR
ncbi:MAG: 4-hydroxy-tetrahydrodipicolinate synthase [Actinobacteria bacterium 13_2_20CM_2_72_6]|nr:MAG: 4-hydroxy-tetrahydrodipicolinate synthase [Actinobacteria bacterium 13_2_20CM_2_72_6]